MEIRKLNTLRGIAALIVVISHYSNSTDVFGGVLGHGAGQMAVMLFFMLSGFLMAYLYLDRDYTKANVANFGIARTARVVPLFLVVVLGSYFLHVSGVSGILYNIPDINALLSQLLLLSGVDILWTIPTEIHFYILFLVLWWLRANNAWYLFAVIALVFILFILFDFPNPRWRIHGLLIHAAIIPSLPYFLVGVTLGWIYRRWPAPSALRRDFFVLPLLLLPLLYPRIFQLLTGYQHRLWWSLGLLIAMTAIFFAVVFLVPDDNRLLSNRVGDFLGKVSYSVYLLHKPLLNLITVPAREHTIGYLFLFVGLTLLVAYASYLVIEHPTRALIRRLGTKKRAPVGT